MPRETLPRKRKQAENRSLRRGSKVNRASRVRIDDFWLMSDANDQPAMQNPEKDPQEWTTGDEPMTGPQRSYLQTLCREANEEFDDTLTKAQASIRIDELQAKTGRGKSN